MRRTLYCDGESPAAAVTALDRSAASHADRTSAISTSSSSESRIAIGAAGGGTDMGDNYSSRGVFVKACGSRRAIWPTMRRGRTLRETHDPTPVGIRPAHAARCPCPRLTAQGRLQPAHLHLAAVRTAVARNLSIPVP